MPDEPSLSELADIVLRARALPVGERETFLAAACGDDADLLAAAVRLAAIPTADVDRLEHFNAFNALAVRPELEPGTVFGKYRIIKKLADGGMSTVYLAEHIRNHTQVAIKFLNPVGLRFSALEHQILGELSHDNIARLFDSDTTDDNVPYLVMEYVDGQSLAEYCDSRALSLDDRLALFIAICAGIQHAHGAPIVHRDLKPGNILVTKGGVPKLVDFGIARALSSGSLAATLTDADIVPKTLAFASPEQVLGQRVGIATDIYSLGIILCVLLTGRLPYRVRTFGELYAAIPTQEPTRPSELLDAPHADLLAGAPHYPYLGPQPPGDDVRRLRRRISGDLDAIVLKAIRKEPEKRYQTVAEFADDIARYLRKHPVKARKGGVRYRMLKFVRRRWKEVLAASVVGMLLVIGAVLFIRQHAETVRERDRALVERQRAEDVSRFLVGMFAVPRPWARSGHQTTVKEVLDRAVVGITASPPRSVATRGTLLHALGLIHLNLGMYASAEALLTPAVRNLQAEQGADPSLINGILLNLAHLHYYHGRYDDAEQYAKRILSASPSPDSRVRRDTRSLLGHIAFARGKYAEAGRLFADAASRPATAAGIGAAESTAALNDLGCALHEQGRVAEAERLYQQSIALGRQAFGGEYADVMRARNNLAHAYEDEGRLGEAEAVYRDLSIHLDTLNPSDSTMPLVQCSLGSFLLSQGHSVRGEDVLTDCFGWRRNVLPDTHPAIARAMAELGRAAHLRGKPVEAEGYYRESVRRLRQALGPRHPDILPVLNNLAVLLSERGRLGEAGAVWNELASEEDAAAHLPPSVRSAVQNNEETFRHTAVQGRGETHTGTSPYVLLLLREVGLSEPTLGDSPAPMEQRADTPPQPSRVIFSDDFGGDHPDPWKWDYGGNTVVESNGQLHVVTTVTDAGGWARTVPIPFDRTRPLIISRRARVHAANKYFDGGMNVGFIGYPENRFGVSYANYYYTGKGEVVTVGFSLIRRYSNPHVYQDRALNASPLIAPVWDRWFDEKLVYDPQTGDVRYFLDGTLRLEYNVDPAPPQAKAIAIGFSTWGWYTGHYQYMDSIAVSQ